MHNTANVTTTDIAPTHVRNGSIMIAFSMVVMTTPNMIMIVIGIIRHGRTKIKRNKSEFIRSNLNEQIKESNVNLTTSKCSFNEKLLWILMLWLTL